MKSKLLAEAADERTCVLILDYGEEVFKIIGKLPAHGSGLARRALKSSGPERSFYGAVCLLKPLRESRSRMDQAQRLRDLAAWYREFAERTENPAIWDSRLRTAEELEREAEALESRNGPGRARAS
jgi:hypothetical protein